MSQADEVWFRLMFKIRLYGAYGDSFQALINQVYHYEYPGFQSISPWGNWGDGGNDGYIKDDGHYFQIYGPKPTTVWNPLDAINKAVDDFKKTRSKWNEVKKYYFIVNDRFAGIPAPVESALQALQKDNSLADSKSIGCGNLENSFSKLSSDQKMMMVGGAPGPLPEFIDARAVGELLTHLADRSIPAIGLIGEKSPDFDNKILLNGLCSPISDWLTTYSYHSSIVDEFLNTRGPGLQQAISEEIKRLYLESKNQIPDSDVDAPNIRYVWMLDKLVPESYSKHPHSQKAYNQASQIVLSKFFETCDAYEHPDSLVAS